MDGPLVSLLHPGRLSSTAVPGMHDVEAHSVGEAGLAVVGVVVVSQLFFAIGVESPSSSSSFSFLFGIVFTPSWSVRPL